MNNSEKYKMLADGETGVPSNMGIIPANSAFKFTEENIKNSLSLNKDFKLKSFEKVEENNFSAQISYKGENFQTELYIYPVSGLRLEDFGFANQIEESEFVNAQNQSDFIEASMFFGENILDSFHLQLKIMNAIVPDASLVIDFMSYRLLSAQWARMTAVSSIPPSPNYLYTIHGVYNEKDNDTSYWFHTHGLLRCKTVELEILNISDGPQQMNDLINMVVKKFLQDPAKENEKFQIGYDGMGINLAWIRWEEALKDYSEEMLGGLADREGDDNVHADPSGILFAVEESNLVSPQIYSKSLSENPIFYISNEETKRMSDLAKERFGCFKDTYFKYGVIPAKKSFFKNIFGKKEQTDEPWRFIVKLGLTVDESKDGTEKEHLWFDVLGIEGDYIEGLLLNQPYWIASLNEGDINKYPVELLTDWLIYSPDNQYTTDSIYQLGYYK